MKIQSPRTPKGTDRFRRPRSSFSAAYLKSFEAGALQEKIEESFELLRSCVVCPRECGVNRLEDKRSICRTGRLARVSSAFVHFGEEDCLRGTGGSGTIFFAWCNLKCVFCQNSDISQRGEGEEVTPAELASLMLRLQSAGCHNINFVTPEHVVPQILEALPVAIERGLRVPIVYNTGGYDSPDSLRLMQNIVDIYMPDFKFWDPERSLLFLGAKDYPVAAQRAVKAMHEQVGELTIDERGVAMRGVLVRHLVMPGMAEDTRAIMEYLAKEISPDTFVNIMDQYRPAYKVTPFGRYDAIARGISRHEMSEAFRSARSAGLWRIDGS